MSEEKKPKFDPEDWQRRSRDFCTWATEVSPLQRLQEELDLDEEEEQALALFDMLAFTRWRRPLPNEIARSLIVVDPLPGGATPIYCHDFDVTSAVIGDDEDEE